VPPVSATGPPSSSGPRWGYILIKFVQRRRFLRGLRIARITPDELKGRLDKGGRHLCQSRHTLGPGRECRTYAIPGAMWICRRDIERRRHDLPRDREIILYCS